jgi:hypothetical protein
MGFNVKSSHWVGTPFSEDSSRGLARHDRLVTTDCIEKVGFSPFLANLTIF